MRFLILAAMGALLAGAGPAAAETPAPAPAYIGRYTTTPEDTREIRQVIADFQEGIKTKNTQQLASLVLNADIPFVSPLSPEAIRRMREKRNPNADGLRAGGFHEFARAIYDSKTPLEERFYNVRITQDKHVAWVMFDYEFVDSGKVQNYGIETWQMMKNVDGKWKIASVWWSSSPPPGAHPQPRS